MPARKNPVNYLLCAASAILAACTSPEIGNSGTPVTVYEGARLITGDGGAPIEDSAFIVANDRFVRVGRRGEVPVPAGAARVDLAGKTVMPTLVDLHGHYGFQDIAQGTMSKETFTRENLIDHMQRLAYHGVGAAVGVGDLIDRSDMRGGRTNWGDVPLQLRQQVVPGAALFRTAGAGMAWPGSGAQGHPSRVDVSYPVATVEEARAARSEMAGAVPAAIGAAAGVNARLPPRNLVNSASGTRMPGELLRLQLVSVSAANFPVCTNSVRGWAACARNWRIIVIWIC